MSLCIETGDLANPAEQFAYWREVVCETWFGLWAERETTCAFDARITLHELGHTKVATAQMPAHCLGRGSAEAARLSQAAYCIQLLHDGAAHGRYRGADYEAQAGDLLLFDTAESCDTFIHQQINTTILHIPHHVLERRLTAFGSPPVRLCARQGAGALLAGYISTLTQTMPALPAFARDKAADILCDLIVVSFATSASTAETARGGVREARLALAQKFITANLTDPRLGIGKVAAHLGVSDRYVQKLFERTGRTFSETLLDARLDACALALRDPKETHRTIADIAFGYGFNDLSWFYRCYRARWGEAPGDTRMRASPRNA